MPMLLVGKESVYVKDLCDENYDFNERFGGLISEKEVFNTEHLSHLSESDKLKEAKLNFSRQALELEKILGLGPIKFDTLEEAKTEDGYTVNFRYLPRSFKRGIIKGSKEGSETPMQTILREVGEEVGINIPEAEQRKIIDLGICSRYKTFSLDITKKARDVFLRRIQERFAARSGEIYEFSFKTLPEIDSLLHMFNEKSKCAIELFKTQILPTITKPKGGNKLYKKQKKQKTKKTQKHKKNKNTKKHKK
jgi:hypothetical protein